MREIYDLKKYVGNSYFLKITREMREIYDFFKDYLGGAGNLSFKNTWEMWEIYDSINIFDLLAKM